MVNDKRLLRIGAVVALFLVVLLIINYVWFPFLTFTENREAGQDVVEQTIDAENAIQEYEQFRVLYNDIQAQHAQLQNEQEALDRFYNVYGENPDEWSRQARQDHSRIQQRITGYQNQLENLIAEYNTMSETATSEIFQCSLPYQVEDRLEVQGPPGSGSADEASGIEAFNQDGESVEVEEVPEAENCDGLPDRIQQGGS